MENRQRRFLITFFIVFAVTCTFLITTDARARFNAEHAAMQQRADEFDGLVSDWFRDTQGTLQILDYEINEPLPTDESSWRNTCDMLQKLNDRRTELSDAYVYNPDWYFPLITCDDRYTTWQLPAGVISAYEGAMQLEGGIFVTTPYISQRYNVYCVTLSKAIYSNTGEFLCVACVDCYLDKLIDILGRFYSDKSYAFLVDKSGSIINHPHPAYQMRMDRVRNISEFSYSKAFETDGIRLIRDYDGDLRACLAIPDEDTGFTIVVLESWQQVYGGVLRALAISAATLLLGFVLMWIILRAQTRLQAETTRQLKEAADVAERASHAKSAFLANMSHEIRTPIHSVLGMDEMILRDSDQPEIVEYATHIRQAGNTLLELINSILDFSKLESEKMELITAPYLLHELMSELENMMRLRAKEKELLFIVSVDSSLPLELIGDEPRLRQILLNLLTNAVKYTQKGQIRFSAALVGQQGDTARIRFEVSDTGIGIREEHIDRLFLSFDRLDEAQNRNIEGTGLGLAIVYRLLELMDSKLEVDSTYGLGSTFAFEVEQQCAGSELIGNFRERAAREVPQEVVNRAMSSLQGRVLAVDDVRMNLMVLQNFLKNSKVQVDAAESGEQALELLRSNSYDLILLDHMMPHMDGMETLAAIREQHLADGVPCVALTANAISGAQQMYLDAGFDGYLSKPISSRDLYDALEKYLGGADQGADATGRRTPSGNKLTLDLIRVTMPEIDITTGLAYCGGTEEFFIPLLEEFAASTRFDRLGDYFEAEDWRNYRVLVYGLRSSALMVGLTALSEQAKELERAVRAQDYVFIRRNHGALMSRYFDTVARLRPLFTSGGGGDRT